MTKLRTAREGIMFKPRRLRRALAAGTIIVAATLATSSAHAGGDPLNWQVPADEGSCVRLVTGGPRGCGTMPHGLPVGAPAQVFHIPWQEAGWNGRGLGLWVINDHGNPVARPPGAVPLTVMDHTLVIVRGPNGIIVGEFLPEGEGNWNVHPPGSDKCNFYLDQLRQGRLVPGPRGTVRDCQVGRVYGLGDNCCTNTANDVIRNPQGGCAARGLNRVGFELNRWGVTPCVRDGLGRLNDRLQRCDGQQMWNGLQGMGTYGPIAAGGGVMVIDGGGRLIGNDDPIGIPEAAGGTFLLTGAGGLTLTSGGTFLTGAGFTGTGALATSGGTALCSVALPATACVATAGAGYYTGRCIDNASGGRISDGAAVGICAVGDTFANVCWRWYAPGCNWNYGMTSACADAFGAGDRPSGGSCSCGNVRQFVDPAYAGAKNPAVAQAGIGGCSMVPANQSRGGSFVGLILLCGAVLWRRRSRGTQA